MKVYVLTEGEYSDYHVVTVKLEKGQAEKLARIHPDWEVEEYDTDEITIKESYMYRVYVYDEGVASAKTINDDCYETMPTHIDRGWPCLDHWEVDVRAEDADHAIKKGVDRIAQYKYREVED